MNKSFHLIFAGVVSLVTASAEPRAAASDSAGLEFFEKKVRPVLAERCYECHSHQAKKLKAGLYLDSRSGALKGGDTGVAIVLGEPEKSRMIEAIRHTNPDLQMPPKQKLPDEIIANLVAWVKMGAPWPEEPKSDSVLANQPNKGLDRRQQEHWAWQPIRVISPPAVKQKDWARNPIDHFVLATLEEKSLKPARPAERHASIRRAYFDLIGLPPSVQEVEDSVGDPSPDAWEKVLDRLLANPHYGERFGRHWLDVARYGEDQAHSFQPRLYPQGFRYRDWLVRAFNQDLPYDRFIRNQIAGDLLDEPDRANHLAALGFFALGPVYYGDKKMFDQWDDRIDTLTRGFQGLTVACARCHDHKYDPISQKDYYALAGILASSDYLEAPLAPTEVVEKYDRAQAAVQAKEKAIEKLVETETASLNKALLADIAKYIMAAWNLHHQRQTNAQASAEAIAQTEGLHLFVLERWMKYLTAKQERPHLAPWMQMLAQPEARTGLSSDPQAADAARKIAEGFQKYVHSVVKLRDAINENYAAAQALLADKDKDKASRLALDKSQAELIEELLGKEGILAVSKNQIEKLLAPELKSRLAALKTELEKLKRDAPPKYPFVHSLKEGAKLIDLPVLMRGNQDSPGETAPRRFLAILSGNGAPSFTNGSGRLQLARAIADRSNPLTARVMVNRIWQHHFGQGLVRTPSNFGGLGEPPTHPALLDFLADYLVEHDWSIKSLHRLIMLSATYQMSSQFDARHHELDPENKLLWRMNRRRMEVEVWRDAMLAVSGNLDATLGGPSVSLASPDNRRRTFYGAVSRHELDPLLRLFDFPDPNVTSDQRTVTTVPLQQLFVLNSEFIVRQAKALAARITTDSNEVEAHRIQRAFWLVYGRPPREPELKLGLKFLAESVVADASHDHAAPSGNSPSAEPSPSVSRWEQYAQVLLSANEFMYVD